MAKNPYIVFIGERLCEKVASLINEAASSDTELAEVLSAMEQRVIRVVVQGIDYEVEFTVEDGLVFISVGGHKIADLTVSGRISDYMEVLASESVSPTQLEGIEIVGDLRLAQRLHTLFRQVDLDWEELVAKRTGDILARQLGNLVRWGQKTVFGFESKLAYAASSYLFEQSHLVAPRTQVENFMNDVDSLQADVDRLEQRIERLGR